MKIHDVFADEVVHFGAAVLLPEAVEVQVFALVTEILQTCHIADRRVHPHIKILIFGAGNGKAEVRSVTGDIPGP